MTNEKHLSCDRVFTWRRLDSGFHPVRRDSGEENPDGNLILALPVFRPMRSSQSATAGREHWMAKACLLLRSCWRRIWRFVVQHLHGGPYILIIYVLPDFVSERLQGCIASLANKQLFC